MNTIQIKEQVKQCRNCYRCIEECPTKAIKVNASNTTVDEHLCIKCGRCVFACQKQENLERSENSEFHNFLKFIKKSKNIFVS